MKIATIAIVLTIPLLTIFPNSLRAEEEKSPALKLIELLNFSETSKVAATASFAPFIQQMKAKGMPDEAIKEVSAAADRFFSKTFDNPEIRADIVKVYEEIYTKEEIEELIAFYNTPLGKKTLDSMTKIMHESQKAGQKYAMENQGEFQAELQAIMAKYAPAPPQ